MQIPLRKSHPLLKMLNNLVVEMPAPVNISACWNFGSLLGIILIFQIATGLLLAIHYSSAMDHAFSSIVHICRDVNYGCLLRTLHANGASFFFTCIYLHIARALYYNSFLFTHVWNVGVTLLFMSMATAFLGYVLPWGQMSFWGATVITNLLSTVPYMGLTLVQWLWGGFAVDAATLSRFYAFHFLLPFLISAMVMIHILFLHQQGSSNPLGINSKTSKLFFHPYFTLKDGVGFTILFLLLFTIVLQTPYLLGDPENFTLANPLVTPPHIQPEWYYLFAYAILRSIPNKLGGVIALVLSVAVLYLLPLCHTKKNQSLHFYPFNQILLYAFFTTVGLLTWIGARPVEAPYIIWGQIFTGFYFMFFTADPILSRWWDDQNSYF